MPKPPVSRRSLDLVMRLMAIPGPSGEEAAVMQAVRGELRRAGVPASAMCHDQGHRRGRIKGQVGNLIVKLPGRGSLRRQPRRMLMAHVDTVPLCVGSRPVRRGGWLKPADPTTALGADDRAGVAAVIAACGALLEQRLDHPPLTLLFCVQEEIGMVGARQVALGKLGRPAMAFNFDGGSPAKLTIGATGAYRLRIVVHGVAAHAGVAPEHGVSAVTIAAMAVARLQDHGWLGKVNQAGRQGTSNIGYIHGGGPTNVVSNQVELMAEVRSHDKVFRRQLLRAFIGAFKDAAQRVSNVAGRCGRVRIEHWLDYEAYRIPRRHPVVKIAETAVRAAGAEPIHAIANGGLDANWMHRHGIPTVSLGAGQHQPHMTEEMLNIDQFNHACHIALLLASGA